MSELYYNLTDKGKLCGKNPLSADDPLGGKACQFIAGILHGFGTKHFSQKEASGYFRSLAAEVDDRGALVSDPSTILMWVEFEKRAGFYLGGCVVWGALAGPTEIRHTKRRKVQGL